MLSSGAVTSATSTSLVQQLQVVQVRDPADADPAPEQLDTAADGQREGDLRDAGVGRDHA